MTDITVPFNQQEFAIAPEGTQPAVCYGVVLIGTQPTQFGDKKKIRLIFELHGDESMPDGRPFSVSQDFTFSSNEKASLRVFIEDWRGRRYTTEELKQSAGLPISKLVGQSALVSISHTHEGENTWVNIKTIMKPPKGMTAPEQQNPSIIYSVDDHNQEMFDKLSPKLQERIKKTPEWRMRMGELPSPMQNVPSTEIPSDFNDEIPF